MLQLRQEVLAYTRACERLLSQGLTLTEDERNLLGYYIQELSRKFFREHPCVDLPASQQTGLETSVKI